MNKRTVVNQIEITQAGHLQIRMCKEIVDDDGSVISSEYHRTAIECGGNVSGQMEAVNDHLAAMGWPGVAAGEIGQIVEHAAVAWTPERCAMYGAAKAKLVERQTEQSADGSTDHPAP